MSADVFWSDQHHLLVLFQPPFYTKTKVMESIFHWMNLLLLQQEIIQQYPPGIPIHFSASSPSLGSPSPRGGMLGRLGMDGGDYWTLSHSAGVWVILLHYSRRLETPHTRSTTKHSTTKTHCTYYLCAEAAYLHHRNSPSWNGSKSAAVLSVLGVNKISSRVRSCPSTMLRLSTCPADAWSHRSCTKIII